MPHSESCSELTGSGSSRNAASTSSRNPRWCVLVSACPPTQATLARHRDGRAVGPDSGIHGPGAHRLTAARSCDSSDFSSCSPSSADAPVGSPSTLFGLSPSLGPRRAGCALDRHGARGLPVPQNTLAGAFGVAGQPPAPCGADGAGEYVGGEADAGWASRKPSPISGCPPDWRRRGRDPGGCRRAGDGSPRLPRSR